MKYDNFSKDSQVTEITVVNGVYDPGNIYFVVKFKPALKKEDGQSIVALFKENNIKSHLEPWQKHWSGEETQRVIIDDPIHAALVFNLLLQQNYITESDRADLGGLVIKIETMLNERTKLSRNPDDITTAQKDVIVSFISPYLEDLFTTCTYSDSIALVKLALGSWGFDPSRGSHKSDWLHIMKMNKMKELSEKISKDQSGLEDVCTSLTMISGMCSGKCGLNKTLLQLGNHLPTIPIIMEIISPILTAEIEKRFPNDVHPGWDNFLNKSFSSSRMFFHHHTHTAPNATPNPNPNPNVNNESKNNFKHK